MKPNTATSFVRGCRVFSLDYHLMGFSVDSDDVDAWGEVADGEE